MFGEDIIELGGQDELESLVEEDERLQEHFSEENTITVTAHPPTEEQIKATATSYTLKYEKKIDNWRESLESLLINKIMNVRIHVTDQETLEEVSKALDNRNIEQNLKYCGLSVPQKQVTLSKYIFHSLYKLNLLKVVSFDGFKLTGSAVTLLCGVIKHQNQFNLELDVYLQNKNDAMKLCTINLDSFTMCTIPVGFLEERSLMAYAQSLKDLNMKKRKFPLFCAFGFINLDYSTIPISFKYMFGLACKTRKFFYPIDFEKVYDLSEIPFCKPLMMTKKGQRKFNDNFYETTTR